MSLHQRKMPMANIAFHKEKFLTFFTFFINFIIILFCFCFVYVCVYFYFCLSYLFGTVIIFPAPIFYVWFLKEEPYFMYLILYERYCNHLCTHKNTTLYSFSVLHFTLALNVFGGWKAPNWNSGFWRYPNLRLNNPTADNEWFFSFTYH